ncbi:MAG TPA: hypothetical protein VH475_09990 [Tepidisphaeraceae bacterium]|jgi:hypothetical protein
MCKKDTDVVGEIGICELKAELSGFTGTTQYFRHWLGLNYTDGVKHLADRVGAHWLIDAIASWQPEASRIDRHFQLWELSVDQDRRAVLSFRRDSGLPADIQQKIEYTDFPVGCISLYVENGVLLLPSEH